MSTWVILYPYSSRRYRVLTPRYVGSYPYWLLLKGNATSTYGTIHKPITHMVLVIVYSLSTHIE